MVQCAISSGCAHAGNGQLGTSPCDSCGATLHHACAELVDDAQRFCSPACRARNPQATVVVHKPSKIWAFIQKLVHGPLPNRRGLACQYVCMLCREQKKPFVDCLIRLMNDNPSNGTAHLQCVHRTALRRVSGEHSGGSNGPHDEEDFEDDDQAREKIEQLDDRDEESAAEVLAVASVRALARRDLSNTNSPSNGGVASSPGGSDAPMPALRKRRFDFTTEYDIVLLREVVGPRGLFTDDGFVPRQKWKRIYERLVDQGIDATLTAIRARLRRMASAHELILAKRSAGDGSEGDQTELEALLSQYVQLEASSDRERPFEQKPSAADHSNGFSAAEAVAVDAEEGYAAAAKTDDGIKRILPMKRPHAGSMGSEGRSSTQDLHASRSESSPRTKSARDQRAKELALMQQMVELQRDVHTKNMEMQEKTLVMQQKLVELMDVLVKKMN